MDALDSLGQQAGSMNDTWGVYNVRGRLKGGTETVASDRNAVSFFVRWRVNGTARRRSFKTRGHARTFRDLLLKAKLNGWHADDRGWPVDPAVEAARPAPATEGATAGGRTLESYVEEVWWPTLGPTLGDKNRLGHRRNATLAVQLLRLKPGDPRLTMSSAKVGNSISLAQLTSDDIKAALVARRGINGRTAAVNRRRIEQASANAPDDTVVEMSMGLEVASPATVRAFFITLGMIVASAKTSGQVLGNPMQGAETFAPKARPKKMGQRLVPSRDELFDLADAIAQLGPMMPDGRPRGDRFRSLILVGGTTGPRPGELVAHRPTWIDWDIDPAQIRFHKTEAAVYGSELEPGQRGRRERDLKHRDEDDFRVIPMISDVRAALNEHIERGYSSFDRTWLSPTSRGHLDWGNIEEDYWRPALRAVFAGTAKQSLVSASPKILRKTAITWWSERGISQTQAAEWAGHTEEVARIYYASRSSTTYAREIALLDVREEWRHGR